MPSDAQRLHERIAELEEQLAALERLEAARQRNVDLFEALLASSHDGITLTRADRTIIRVVRSVLRYAGVDLAGVDILTLVHPDDRHIMEESYRKIVSGGTRCIEHELRLLRGDGTVAWVEGTMTDMLDHPAVHAVVHNYRDATLRTEQDWTIRELSVIVDKSPYAIFSKTPSGEIVTWHPGAQRTFGYTAAEILGKHIWALVPPELREEESRQRAFILEQGRPGAPFRTRRIRKDGTQVEIELVLIPILIHGQIRGVAHLSHLVEPPSTGQ